MSEQGGIVNARSGVWDGRPSGSYWGPGALEKAAQDSPHCPPAACPQVVQAVDGQRHFLSEGQVLVARARVGPPFTPSPLGHPEHPSACPSCQHGMGVGRKGSGPLRRERKHQRAESSEASPVSADQCPGAVTEGFLEEEAFQFVFEGITWQGVGILVWGQHEQRHRGGD